MEGQLLDSLTASVFTSSIRGLTFSSPIVVSITLCQISGLPVYDPATATTTYPETQTPLSAFRGVVSEGEATKQIRVGDVWWAVNPADLTTAPKPDDRVVDADSVSWTAYKIGDPDPTDSLIRIYTRRSTSGN